MPAVRPPALFERWIQRPASPRPSMTSWTADPNRRVCSKPEPELDALDDVDAHDRGRRAPRRAADPTGRTSRARWGRPSRRPRTRRRRCRLPRAPRRCGRSSPPPRRGPGSAAATRPPPRGSGVALAGSTATPPTSAVNDQTSMPSSRRNARATPPAATRAAVSRADARSSTLRTSSWPYLSAPARSPCPGRTRVTGVDRLSPPSIAAASAAASSSTAARPASPASSSPSRDWRRAAGSASRASGRAGRRPTISRAVVLDLLARAAAVAALAAGQVDPEVRLGQREARRHALDDHAERPAVGLARGQEAERLGHRRVAGRGGRPGRQPAGVAASGTGASRRRPARPPRTGRPRRARRRAPRS